MEQIHFFLIGLYFEATVLESALLMTLAAIILEQMHSATKYS